MPGRLLHSPARVIMELLVAAGYGVDIDDDEDGLWPIFVNRTPDKPDDVVRVQGTVGRSFGDSMVDGEHEEDYGIQILTRSADDNEGYLKTHNIAIFLDGVTRIVVDVSDTETGTGTGTDNSTYLVHAMTRQGSVIPLGNDVPQGKRWMHSVNFTATIRLCC